MTIHYSFVGRYAPAARGMAGFTDALRGALLSDDVADAPVARVVHVPPWSSTAEVVAELVAGHLQSIRSAAAAINQTDVTIVHYQHGLYGGRDGDDILALLDAVRVPRIVVLQTMPGGASWRQRWVIQAMLARAEAVVVTTAAARDRLVRVFDADPKVLTVIPRGAYHVGAVSTDGPSTRPSTGRPTVLTWGLLDSREGIEWGIDAMCELMSLDPAPRYVVSGPTRSAPGQDGEAYRAKLVARIERLGLADYVEIENRCRDGAALERLIRAVDVALLPYDPPHQVTSGVLSEAVAALVPVVATPFPYALELLSDGAGFLVAPRDASGIAAALRTLLTRPEVAAKMRRAAARRAPELSWSAIAPRYQALAAALAQRGQPAGR